MNLNLNAVSRFRFELMLLAILILGAFLRIDGLSKESIWFDESRTVYVATSGSLFQVLKTNIEESPMHAPLYYTIMHFWIVLFGDSEFSVRFPSVIFGVLAILVIFKVGSLIFDKETGLLAALILAVSKFNIFYSQEARMYSLLSFLTLLSFYFFIKSLKRASTGVSIGYILSSILLMYTHVFGLFVIIAQNMYIATFYLYSRESFKEIIKKWVLFQLVLLILFMPQCVVYMKFAGRIQGGDHAGTEWISDPSLNTILESFKEFSGTDYLLLPFLLLLAFSIIPNGESYQDKKLSHNSRIYLLLLWLLAPILLPFIISELFAPLLVTRYTIGASLALYLFVAKGIRDINQKHLKIIVLSLIIGVSLAHVIHYKDGIHKQQWREATADLESHAEPGDLVLITPGWVRPAFDYYSKRTDLVKLAVSSDRDEELWTTIEGYRRVLVISLKGSAFMNQRLNEYYSESYNNTSYRSAQVYLFEKKQ